MAEIRAAGERDLSRLLSGLRPVLCEGVFVFATLPPGAATPAGLTPLMRFEEAEGTTLIMEADAAAVAGLHGVFRSRMITLAVPSSLEAVGFVAVIATRLAVSGISVNPVAGFHHDHLFVPEDRAQEAMASLEALATESTA
ncbi:MAG: ACT domain-containing protein [Pseudomonadota bacterium]